jgi:poly(A) polymerase
MLDGLARPNVAPSLTLALGVLLHDVGKPATFRVAERIRFDGHVEKGIEIAHVLLTRLRFPNQVIEGVEALIANHMKFMEVPRMRESTLKRFMRVPDFEQHMELHRLDCLSSHGGLENYELVRRKQQEMPPEQLKPAPLLTGRELIAAGYRPGPMFGIVLSEIEDAQLEGRISTAAEALELARQKLDLN